MAPKKQPPMLTLPGSNTVPAPTERHTWALHLAVKDDHIRDKLANNLVEAGSFGEAFETRSLDSFGESQDFQTLFIDNKDGEGVISPLISFDNACETEEVPFCTINFVSKVSRHAQFDSWSNTIFAQPGLKKKLNELGS